MSKAIEECANKHGFKLELSEEISEISGQAYKMIHEKSGAKLLFLQNDDQNKAFSISFKTPAADDTGVFHILEHSVLCGSKKFPVKEPFVDLLKSSMQTFLNAMTFPDKTMYPVASTNDLDLKNLADVYMDAVFNPAIYTNENIFKQEGWHLEPAVLSMTDDCNQSSDTASHELVYNGVVFNEMKGALSDSDSVLYDAVSAALFPDTTYSFESGGIPAKIPTLTYEQFLDTHSRHYRTDNSYIVLYGDINIDDFLEFLDSKYLTPLASSASEPLKINPLELQRPVCNSGVKVYMQTSPENTSVALGYVVGKAQDRTKVYCADLLLDAISGSNVSPLKKAVLDAGLADDFRAFLSDSLAQPFIMLELKGVKGDSQAALAKFKYIVEDCIKNLVAEGIERDLLSGSIARSEFTLRENDYGVSDGVIYAMSVMSGWLYDEEEMLSYLRYEDSIKFAKESLNGNYFEELAKEIFLNNNHACDVELVCQDFATPQNKEMTQNLSELSKSLTDAQYEQIKSDALSLKAAQQAPDDPEALKMLPRLKVSDLKDAPIYPGYTVDDDGMTKTIIHEIDTHGIAYFYRYFDMSVLNFEDFAYASVLSMVLGKLDTGKRSARELDNAIQNKLGNLDFYIEVHELPENPSMVIPKFVVSTSALEGSFDSAATLVNEILQTTDFYDFNKLRDILTQKRVAMEQYFASSGNAAALMRVGSYYSYAGVLRDQIGGIGFYYFLLDLLKDFDLKAQELASRLKKIADSIFCDDDSYLSFAGPKVALDMYRQAGYLLGVSKIERRRALEIPEPVDKHEAFIVPADVCFAALGADRRTFAGAYNGAWLVLSRILSYDYLWNTVRVQGGAYGVSFRTSRSGSSYFSSYRDPHLNETLARFNESGAWVINFEATSEIFDGYIVATVASIDTPVKPRTLLRRQDTMYFTNFTQEERDEIRSQVISCTINDIRTFGPRLDELASQKHMCCVGSASIIKANNLDFNVINLF